MLASVRVEVYWIGLLAGQLLLQAITLYNQAGATLSTMQDC
jgi:hypothetical protein